jgi:hypothetical protein
MSPTRGAREVLLVGLALGASALGCDPSHSQAPPTTTTPTSAAPATPTTTAPGPTASASASTSAAGTAGPPPSSALAGIVPADRLVAWNPGLRALGGIPARTRICATLTPSGGDDTKAIQSAIDRCPLEQVVQLGSGTFKITGQGLAIARSNVTLRGSGPSSTRLVKAKGTSYPVVIIGHRWPKYIDPMPLAADALQGDTKVTLHGGPASRLALQAGELVVVDHLTNELTWWSSRSPPDSPSRSWFGEPDRPIGQVLEIESVTGDHVTFTTALHADFKVADAAQMTRYADNGLPITRPVERSGIEDLYVEYGEGGDGGGNIHLFATKACWVKNVESNHSEGHSVNLDGTFRSEVRDSFFHSTVNPNPGGSGYGMGMNTYASDNLFENNISWNFNKVVVMRKTGGGNVVAYNYMEDGYGAGYPTIVEVGLNGSHMTTSHHELFEGNQSFNFDSDSVWGNSIDITAFRNHLTSLRRSLLPGTADGVRVPLTDQLNRRAVGLTINQWWYSFVGNVLGYPAGYLQYPPMPAHLVYEWQGAAGNSGVFMWQLGYDGEKWVATPDAKVVSTTIRHGNYDYASKAIVWDKKIPSRVLPASLYLTSKPDFFGSSPWPWVTPENPRQQVWTLPARARFDALPALKGAVDNH